MPNAPSDDTDNEGDNENDLEPQPHAFDDPSVADFLHPLIDEAGVIERTVRAENVRSEGNSSPLRAFREIPVSDVDRTHKQSLQRDDPIDAEKKQRIRIRERLTAYENESCARENRDQNGDHVHF